MRKPLVVTTVVLALLGIAASVEHFLDAEHHNPGYLEFPLVISSHVALGAVYLAIGLVQFNPQVRGRYPRLHRTTARLGVFAGLVAGSTALLGTLLFPYHGQLALPLVGPWAGWFMFALGRGLWLARQRRFDVHREWMIRAFAIGTGIATMRLIFIPLLILSGESGGEESARILSLLSFVAAFALHTAIAELWIRRTRGIW